jgi:hypothetical protein
MVTNTIDCEMVAFSQFIWLEILVIFLPVLILAFGHIYIYMCVCVCVCLYII